MDELHDYIAFFEKDERLIKNKLFRNMSDKLNFYKKLDIN